MKKILVTLATATFVIVCVACDDNDGKQACDAFASKCPAGTATATCSADAINDFREGNG